ncbi:MAG: transposase zinc-binding domain-containing protein [Candidatus Pacebacteria bacterium]|nr:transposase zinc-binding domain-containing protein [Candidatus Paceibacterota bacterium]
MRKTALSGENREEFERVYPDRYQATCGSWRPTTRKAAYEYLQCGDLREGFARVRCPDCGHNLFVAFSCKSSSWRTSAPPVTRSALWSRPWWNLGTYICKSRNLANLRANLGTYVCKYLAMRMMALKRWIIHTLARIVHARLFVLTLSCTEVQTCVVPLDSIRSGTCKPNVTQSLYQRLMKRWQNKA